MKTNKIRLWRLLGLIVLFGALFGLGWYTAAYTSSKTSASQDPATSSSDVVEIYFYQGDGIYRLTSASLTAEKVVAVEINQSNQYQYGYTTSFDFMSPQQNWLVYVEEFAFDQSTGQALFALVVYDLETKTELLRVANPGKSIGKFAISPSKQKLAYVENHYVTRRVNGIDDVQLTKSLYVWDGANEPKQLWSDNDPHTSLAIDRWWDEDTLSIGTGYEGVQFCPFHTLTDTKFSPDCPPTYGRSGMGLSDQIMANAGDSYYGVHYENPLFVSNKNPTNGIFVQDGSGERQYLIKDVTHSLVVSQENIYYLRNSKDAGQYMWNGLESDLYVVTRDGEMMRRLTNDGTSVKTKNYLSASADGRFLTYQVTDLSKVSPEQNSWQEQLQHSEVWLYDTLLNKYYSIAQRAMSPKILIR